MDVSYDVMLVEANTSLCHGAQETKEPLFAIAIWGAYYP